MMRRIGRTGKAVRSRAGARRGSGVNGTRRSLTPVASNTALPIAAGTRHRGAAVAHVGHGASGPVLAWDWVGPAGAFFLLYLPIRSGTVPV
jgi:hypothetical protein